MGSEVQLDAGIGSLKIDLSDFVSAIRALAKWAVGADEKEKAREAIKDLIVEVRKTFDIIVENLEPLYKLTTKASFNSQFDERRAAIKSVYLNRGELAVTRCHIVKQQLDKLKSRTVWMQNLPFAGSAHDNLKKVCATWLESDKNIARVIENFLEELSSFVDEVARLKISDSAKGLRLLSDGLSLLEGNFREMKRQLGELDETGKLI